MGNGDADGQAVQEARVDRAGFRNFGRQLFDRFHRSSTSRALAIPGVGLGLSIARDIVAAHGGRIELESEVGRGTTVRVRLPLDREGAGPAPVGP